MRNKATAALSAQIEKLNANGNVIKAKAWWNGLTPAQKGMAIGLIAGLSSYGVFTFVFKASTMGASMAGVSAYIVGQSLAEVTYEAKAAKAHVGVSLEDV